MATEVFLFRGESRADIVSQAGQIRHLLQRLPTLPLKDVAYSLNVQDQGVRGPATRCLSIVASQPEELVEKIERALQRLADPQTRKLKDVQGIYYFEKPLAEKGSLAFLFPGEGSQYVNMLADLCLHFPVVRAHFDLMDRVFAGHERGFVPSDLIFPPPTFSTVGQKANESRLFQMEGAVETVLTASRALYSLLERLAIKPDALLGHSTGEYTALLASGMIDLPDEASLTRFAAALNQIYQQVAGADQIPQTALVAVGAGAEKVTSLVPGIGSDLFIAMDNCPHQTVIVGEPARVDQAVSRLRSQGIICDPLPFDRPYHTPLFGAFAARLAPFFEQWIVSLPKIPTYSCTLAGPFPDNLAEIRQVAIDHWVQPVRFRQTIAAMYVEGVRIFVEVGPRGNLSSFVSDTLRGKPHLAVPADIPTRPGMVQLAHMLGLLAAHGVPMQLEALYVHRSPEKLDLSMPDKIVQEKQPSPTRVKLKMGWPAMHLSEETAARLRQKWEGASKQEATLSVPANSVDRSLPPAPNGPPMHAPVVNPPVHDSVGEKSMSQTKDVPSAPAASAPDQPAVAHAPPPPTHAHGSAVTQVMSAYFKTMEQFLMVQQEVMQTFLTGQASVAPTIQEVRSPVQSNGKPMSDAALSPPDLTNGVVQDPAAQTQQSAAVAAEFPASPVPSPTAPTVTPTDRGQAPPPAAPDPPSMEAEDVQKILLDLVCDRTGYPLEMLDLNLDLEADLGIDSIKRVEILGSFQQQTNLLQAEDMEELASRRTLQEVLDFIVGQTQKVEEPPPGIPPPTAESPASPAVLTAEDVQKILLDLVCDRTGYPLEMLDLNLDLEADLGIDSIKRVEILGSFQQQTNLLQAEDMEELASRRTLQEVLDFIVERQEPADSFFAVAPPAPEHNPPSSETRGTVPAFPFLETILSQTNEELVAHCEIDLVKYPFLRDHTLGRHVSQTDPTLTGLAVVPFTMSMEMLGEAAAWLRPGQHVIGMQNLRAQRWLALDDERLQVEIVAQAQADDAIQVAIYEMTASGAERHLAVEGLVLLRSAYPDPPVAEAFVPREARPSHWQADQLYEVGMFHGPAFQGVVSMDRWGVDGAVATLRVLSATDLFAHASPPALVTDPVLLDQPGQVVAFWLAEHLGRQGFMILPYFLERLAVYGPPPALMPESASALWRCDARVMTVNEVQMRSDLDIVRGDGRVWARFIGWEDRCFDVPDFFLRFQLAPRDHWLSRKGPLPAAVDSQWAGQEVRQLGQDDFPPDFFAAHGRIWLRVLAHTILGRREREEWRVLPPAQRLGWLMERAVAKDAVRGHVYQSNGLRLCPADIEIGQDEQGRLVADGAWRRDGMAVPVVQCWRTEHRTYARVIR